MNNDATIIALAWPNTKVVKEGKWYDYPMNWIGILKNGYYNAGHAAFLLINDLSGEIHYFDYGRYHTPYKHGRVRDKFTDPDVEIKYLAIFENETIINLEEILIERYKNKACHGDGKLTASIVKNIDFNKAFLKAKEMQAREAIPYGPFVLKGSTCSRLVAQVVYSSTNNRITKFFIKFPYTISATPRSNHKVLNDFKYCFEVIDGELVKKKSKLFWLKSMLSPKKYNHKDFNIDFSSNKYFSKSI